MNTALKTLRLHFVKRNTVILTPLLILLSVVVVTVLISLTLQRVGIDPADPNYPLQARNNAGVLWALGGFVVALGVQSVATTFPFAMALGADRRGFTVGTLLSHVVMAAGLAAVISLLLLVELATDHWLINAYALDAYLLGGGNPLLAFLISFLAIWLLQSVGAAFGAGWLRYGVRGPMFIGLIAGLVLVLILLAIAPQIPAIIEAFQPWWLIIAAAIIILIGVLGQYLFLRRATTR